MGAPDSASVVDKTDYDYYPPELAARYHHDDQLVIESGKPLINREEPTITAEGKARWILTTKVPLRDSQDDIVGLVGIGRDITDRKHIQEQIEKLHAEIDTLYEINKQLSQTLNPATVYRTIHTVITEYMPCDGLFITSYTPKDWCIHWVWAWHDGHPIAPNRLEPIVLTDDVTSHQKVVLRTGKTLYAAQYHTWVNAIEPPVPDSSNEPFCSALFIPLKLENQVIGVVQVFSYAPDAFSIDQRRFLESMAPQAATAVANARLYQQMQHEVQERERAERALRELNESLEHRITERTQELQHSEARYRAVIEDQTELICQSLPDTTITFVNDAYCHFFDISREQIIGQSFGSRIPEHEVADWEKEYRKLGPTNPLVTIEHRLTAGDGEIHWVQWTNRWIEGQDGQTEIQAVGRDITRQKHAEEILRQALVREMDVNHMRSCFISMASPTCAPHWPSSRHQLS